MGPESAVCVPHSHVHTHINHSNMHTHIRANTQTHTQTLMLTCLHTCQHTNPHTHTHTCMFTHVHTPSTRHHILAATADPSLTGAFTRATTHSCACLRLLWGCPGMEIGDGDPVTAWVPEPCGPLHVPGDKKCRAEPPIPPQNGRLEAGGGGKQGRLDFVFPDCTHTQTPFAGRRNEVVQSSRMARN